jgi:hypothetical protein
MNVMTNEACQVEKTPLENMFGGHFSTIMNNSVILLDLIVNHPARMGTKYRCYYGLYDFFSHIHFRLKY